MEFYAHTGENGKRQLLRDHLIGAGELARSFAIPELKNSAYLVGLVHDLGKYSKEFQERLLGAQVSVDHSTYGARVICEKLDKTLLGMMFAYIVAGHHAGLPDKGNKGENADATTLRARLKKECPDAGAWQSELDIDTTSAKAEMMKFAGGMDGTDYEFLIRYLFSCLVDADFIDTERFVCGGDLRPHPQVDWRQCKQRLDDILCGFRQETALQKARNALKEQALTNIAGGDGIYSLDMPTGSGKTLCSLALALERLLKGGKERIIFVIPFAGIVEQTAAVLREIFPDAAVLEHHSGCDLSEIAEEKLGGWNAIAAENADCNAREILKRAAENWDAPIIVTTNVQFFESVYSNRSGKMRKLHNIANSVIVFDEVHTMPIPYFVPCINAIDEFVKGFGSEAIFLTATMPDFAALADKFAHAELHITDLIRDKSEYAKFDKCVFKMADAPGIPTEAYESGSILVITNRKRSAEELYRACGVKEKYCLSTYLTPADRSAKIADIKEALAQGRHIAVFSTSLIEAGVDVDFESVYRELTGLDSVLQAAGRCNREGKRRRDESVVTIFRMPGNAGRETDERPSITRWLIDKYGVENIASAECVRDYFDTLYGARKYTMHGSGGKNWDIDFKSVAENFRLIDSAQVGVVIPCAETEEILSLPDIPSAAKRKLQRHSASVAFYELSVLIENGSVIEKNGVYVLTDKTLYSHETGLKIDVSTGKSLFFGE